MKIEMLGGSIMKKKLAATVVFMLVAAMSVSTVFAADTADNSTITVISDAEATADTAGSSVITDLSDAEESTVYASNGAGGAATDPAVIIVTDPETSELLPVNVIQSSDGLEIRKVYELGPDVAPERLPRTDFERGGFMYTCAEILREVVIGDEIKAVTISETAESEKDDVDTVLSILAPYKEVREENGFLGKLYLVEDSITSEVAGYGTASVPYTVSKSYTNLPSNDPFNIPKTIDDGGRSLQLQDIQWKGDIYSDRSSESGSFTATAIYGGTKTSQYIESYVITANYSGEVSRKGVDVIRYTIIFTGTAIPAPEPVAPPAPVEEPDEGGGGWLIFIFILILLGAGAGAYYFFVMRKSQSRHDDDPHAEYYTGGDGEQPADEADYPQD